MGESSGIALILEQIGLIVSESIDWIESFIQCITTNPLILLFIIVAFVGLGVGLLSRLMHL